MKKFYLFLTAVLALFAIGTTKTNAAEPIRVNLNVDNMEWVKWNSNADKTLAWGSVIKTISGPEITITHTNNNMAFWNRQDLQFYALVGSAHPQNYIVESWMANSSTTLKNSEALLSSVYYLMRTGVHHSLKMVRLL